MAGITRRDALSSVVAALAGLDPSRRSLTRGIPRRARPPVRLCRAVLVRSLEGAGRLLAAQPWSDPKSPYADILEKIDYTAFHQIVYRRDLPVGEPRSGRRSALPPRQVFQGARLHLARGKRPARAKSFIAKPISRCPPTMSRAGCRREWASPASASWPTTRPGTGSPSSALPISARPAAASSTACRRAGWRSTPPCRRREEFPRFSAFWLRGGAGTARPGHHLCACSTGRASPAPTASTAPTRTAW